MSAAKALKLARQVYNRIVNGDITASSFTPGSAAAGMVRVKALQNRLRTCAVRGSQEYLFPNGYPIFGATPRTDATSVPMGAIRSVEARVYLAIGSTGSFTSATTGTGTAPTGTGNYYIDGGVIWGFLGYLAPVAYANNLAVSVDQIVYAGGNEFQTVTAGTTSATGSGPTPTNLTDGTAVFVYRGRQTLPLMTVDAAPKSGLTQQVNWNDTTKRTVLGGTMIQNATNARGGITSRSGDGGVYTETNGGGGGYLFTVSDAPLFAYSATGSDAYSAWVDGKMVALVVRGVVTQHYLHFDFSGVAAPRKVRTIRFDQPFPMKFVGFFATQTDTFAAYSSPDPIKAVYEGDSYPAGSVARFWCLNFPTRLSHSLGIDDFRNAGIGGTGPLNPGLNTPGPTSPYSTRLTQDVISQTPDLVFTQDSGNDGSWIDAGNATVADALAAKQALITRIKNEIPNAVHILLGQWNNRAPPSVGSTIYQLNQQDIALATSNGIPYIEWSNYRSDGGYAGHPNGSNGNSLFLIGDGTHTTGGVGGGDEYNANRLTFDIRSAYERAT